MGCGIGIRSLGIGTSVFKCFLCGFRVRLSYLEGRICGGAAVGLDCLGDFLQFLIDDPSVEGRGSRRLRVRLISVFRLIWNGG